MICLCHLSYLRNVFCLIFTLCFLRITGFILRNFLLLKKVRQNLGLLTQFTLHTHHEGIEIHSIGHGGTHVFILKQAELCSDEGSW